MSTMLPLTLLILSSLVQSGLQAALLVLKRARLQVPAAAMDLLFLPTEVLKRLRPQAVLAVEKRCACIRLGCKGSSILIVRPAGKSKRKKGIWVHEQLAPAPLRTRGHCCTHPIGMANAAALGVMARLIAQCCAPHPGSDSSCLSLCRFQPL